jgi:hypothetical protein
VLSGPRPRAPFCTLIPGGEEAEEGAGLGGVGQAFRPVNYNSQQAVREEGQEGPGRPARDPARCLVWGPGPGGGLGDPATLAGGW